MAERQAGWLHPQKLARKASRGKVQDTHLSACSVSGVTGAPLKSLSPTAHSFLWRVWSSWVFCEAQAPVMLKFLVYHWWMIFLTSGSFTILVAQPQLTVFGLTKARKKPSVLPSPPSLTQTAPLAAADAIQRQRHVQIKLESSFFMCIVCWCPSRHWSLPILWNASGSYE
jgi:hypothetical protein